MNIFLHIYILTGVFGAQKNHLIESTQFFEYPQHIFWLRNKKINI